MVRVQSNGKLNLQVEKFKFNWFSKKMELQNAVFFSTDTATASTGYRFRIDRLRIEVKAILPVLFEKKFLIDSIHVVNPDITVTRLRSNRDTLAANDTTSGLSIPQEMGRIYNSIQDALKVLSVNRFQIDNGRFSLINKIRPYDEPIVISNLNFHLENLKVDTSKSPGEQKILFSDNVALHTTNQDIVFPDGRHRLSFSNFRINILKRLVEFDSCTILATKGDSSKSSFRIFFDKLMLTNIDFDTLYHSEVIKADSVYCINPRFRLDVDLKKRTGPVKPPKLNELIQQLTGNLELAFVIVQNGSFDINTMREGRPSSFTSYNNNFELQGLRIKQDAPRPMTVEKFVMAIRNYENFLRDSTYAIQFDSVLINNNRINLNNFTYQKIENSRVLNKLVIPQFALEGLSWDNLIIGQQLKAENVVLFKPVITYDLTRKKTAVRRDVFQTLQGIAEVMELDNVDVIDGRINLIFRNNIRLELEEASMTLRARDLVMANRYAGIHRSVNNLKFKRGRLLMNGMTLILDDVKFYGANNQLIAGKVQVQTKDRITIGANGVSINSVVISEKDGSAAIDGVRWASAKLDVPVLPKGGGSGNSPLTFTNVSGANTQVALKKPGQDVHVLLRSISADNIKMIPGNPMQIDGLKATGENLIYNNGELKISAKTLAISDRASSNISNVSFYHRKGNDSLVIDVPTLRITPDINALLRGDASSTAVVLEKPVIAVSISPSPFDAAKEPQADALRLGKLSLVQPSIDVHLMKDSQQTSFRWRGADATSHLDITDLAIDRKEGHISVGKLSFLLDHFDLESSKRKRFDAGKGQLAASLRAISLQRSDAGWDWQGELDLLTAKDFILDSLGKRNGTLVLNSGTLKDLSINSFWLLDLRKVVSNNKNFNVASLTGQFTDTVSRFFWNNAGYDKRTRRLTMDSFIYRPTPEREIFLSRQKFQTDYLTARTGRLSVGPLDIDRLTNDTILDLGVVLVDSGFMNSFRDQRFPRRTDVVKPLPVNLLKRIPLKVMADTLRVQNSLIEYEEFNARTNASGKITVSELTAELTRIRNFDLMPTDSLDIRASARIEHEVHTKLHVRESYTDTLSGFLMTATMGPADLKKLNPVLGPLASVTLVSGKLDSMTTRVAGREYLAFGEMMLKYHDLKIRVLKKGGREKRPLLGPLADLLVNTLVKNKNEKRSGTVFFERLRDRSAVNYLVKITLSGITSSVGLRNNRKTIRRYNRQLKEKNLPPIKGTPVMAD